MDTCRSSSTKGSPSFFKVIRYPNAPHLALPVAFVRNNLKRIPKNPTLTTTVGHAWRLKFTKIGEDYCFAHGWDKLAKDVHLSSRDIVVFWLIDAFTFQVSFFDANGCCKDLPLCNKTNNDEKSVDSNHLCFEKVIYDKRHKYYMSLPLKFVKAAGLEHNSSVKVKDTEGNEWLIGILVEPYHQGNKYSFSTSWCKFRRSHQLSNGDVCFFMFDKKEGVLNLTKVVRNKTSPPQDGIGIGSGGGVTIEDERSPIKKPCDGGGVKVANRKKALEIPVNGVKVKTEVGSGSVEAVKRTMGRFSVDKPGSGRSGGVKVKAGQETKRLHKHDSVVYF